MIPVSIVIPSYNGIDLLKQSLPSILSFVDLNFGHEVIVVDDGSKDDTFVYLKEHFRQVRIVSLEKNSGFARASMEGILSSRNRVVALINNDIFVIDDFLSPLLSSFSKDDAFAVGPKVLKRQNGLNYHLRSKAFFKKRRDPNCKGSRRQRGNLLCQCRRKKTWCQASVIRYL